MIGSYGTVVFEASADRVRTWQAASRQGRARWARHDVLGRKPLLEFTGLDLEQVELAIRLDASLGVNPAQELRSLRDLRDAGEPSALTLGGAVLGRYALESVSETWRNTDAAGRLILAEATLSLVEYVEDATATDARGFSARGVADQYLSIYAGSADETLAERQVADTVGRIPEIYSAPGIDAEALARIGSTLAGLGVPSDFSAAGMRGLLASLNAGGGATAAQSAAYSALGLDPGVVADIAATDTAAALRTVSGRVVALPDAQAQTQAVAGLTSPALAPAMRTAMSSFAGGL